MNTDGIGREKSRPIFVSQMDKDTMKRFLMVSVLHQLRDAGLYGYFDSRNPDGAALGY